MERKVYLAHRVHKAPKETQVTVVSPELLELAVLKVKMAYLAKTASPANVASAVPKVNAELVVRRESLVFVDRKARVDRRDVPERKATRETSGRKA